MTLLKFLPVLAVFENIPTLTVTRQGGWGVVFILAVLVYFVSYLILSRVNKTSSSSSESGTVTLILKFLTRWMLFIAAMLIGYYDPRHLWSILIAFMSIEMNAVDIWIEHIKPQSFKSTMIVAALALATISITILGWLDLSFAALIWLSAFIAAFLNIWARRYINKQDANLLTTLIAVVVAVLLTGFFH